MVRLGLEPGATDESTVLWSYPCFTFLQPLIFRSKIKQRQRLEMADAYLPIGRLEKQYFKIISSIEYTSFQHVFNFAVLNNKF